MIPYYTIPVAPLRSAPRSFLRISQSFPPSATVFVTLVICQTWILLYGMYNAPGEGLRREGKGKREREITRTHAVPEPLLHCDNNSEHTHTPDLSLDFSNIPIQP